MVNLNYIRICLKGFIFNVNLYFNIGYIDNFSNLDLEIGCFCYLIGK